MKRRTPRAWVPKPSCRIHGDHAKQQLHKSGSGRQKRIGCVRESHGNIYPHHHHNSCGEPPSEHHITGAIGAPSDAVTTPRGAGGYTVPHDTEPSADLQA